DLCCYLADDELRDLLDREVAREPGCLTMPASARLACDGAHVHLVHGRAERNLARRGAVPRRLANERRDERALDGGQDVDEPLGVRLCAADGLEVVAQEMRDDDPPPFEDLRPIERPREQLELRELDIL